MLFTNKKILAAVFVILSVFLSGKHLAGAEHAGGVKKSSAVSTAVRYRVCAGDTLYSISRSFSVTVDEICRVNHFQSKTLKMGEYIYIPSRKASNRKVNGSKKTVSIAKKEPRVVCSTPRFIWPVNKPQGYESDARNGVKGIGLRIKARPGAPVVSAADGLVKRVGYMRGYGNYIMIIHGGKYMTVYANLETIGVREGDTVNCGCIIGTLGFEDSSLHFQVNNGGRPLDPLRVLR